jgi:hypothetical protein
MQRLPRMDGLRGLLAVYVMLGRAMPLAILPDWITAPFRHGEAGVDLFFALSGMVIANSLERFGGKFWPFMAARAWRLLPVYFVALGLSIVLLMFGNPLAAMPWVGPLGGLFWAAGVPQGFSGHLAAHLLLLHGVYAPGPAALCLCNAARPGLEPFDRMAVLCGDRSDRAAAAGLVRARHAGGGGVKSFSPSAALVAIQPGVSAGRGAIFRAGRGAARCGCGAGAEHYSRSVCWAPARRA